MIVLMGVAGSGKSVQGKLLADRFGYRWLSTGEFLRMNISGQRRQEMLEGKLLKDSEVIDILDKLLEEMGRNEECVLDGFPRTKAQADWLLSRHNNGQLNIKAVIHLLSSEETAKKRLLARARPDDNEQAIGERFDEFKTATLPIINSFKQNGVPVYDINGEDRVDEVQAAIIKALGL